MIHERISVSSFCPEAKAAAPQSCAELITYVRERFGCLNEAGGRWGVIVVPGGGYRILAPSESEPAAMAFLSRGCQVFILNYTLAPARYPTQLLELAGAVAYLKRNAEQYVISHIAVCGLSAGGHLAACLCNLWSKPVLSDTLHETPERFRPDAGILCYPVISARTPKLSPAFGKILGEGVEVSGGYGVLSLETSVSPQNPPCFLWATVGDPQVSAEHSMLYAEALRKAEVPFEMHLFQNGPHAMSTATGESVREASRVSGHVAHWVELAAEWLKNEALS